MKTNIENTLERIKEFKNGRDLFSFGFITDIHTGGCGHVEHLRFFSDSFKKTGILLAVNGGDIGLDLGESEKEAYKMIDATRDNMSQEDVPFIFLKGNHDYGTPHIPSIELFGRLSLPSLERYPKNVFMPDGIESGYGYYLNEKYRILLIFLNTSEGDTARFNISDRQLSFLIRTLESARKGYRVIVSGHMCIDEIGSWNSYQSDAKKPCFEVLRRILEDFVGRKSGAYLDSVYWDFKDSAAKLVSYISGDSHFNNYANKSGVNYVVRQGYGGVDPAEMPIGATHDRFSYNDGMECDTCLFDTIIVSDDACKIIRTGAGEEERDLEFPF